MSASISRAALLIETERYDLAEKELIGVLAEEPNDHQGHALLAVVLQAKKQYDKALEHINNAISLAPYNPFPFHVQASIYTDLDKFKEAIRAVEEAIHLDPENPDYFGTRAWIGIRLRKWKEALKYADQGLELRADHSECHNARAHCLQMLDRHEEAKQSLHTTLESEPENAMTHANMGWQCLRRGEQSQAQEHFLEALRLDPGHEYARAGIIESLKAKNPIYRLILAYFTWMSRLSSQSQWGVIIGALIVYKLSHNILMSNESTKPLGILAIGLYLLFVLTSWAGSAIFDVMLWFHPLGRHVLNSREKIASGLCLACFIIATLSLLYGLFHSDTDFLLWAAVFPFLCLPISRAFSLLRESKRKIGYMIAGAFALIACTGILLDITGQNGSFPFLVCLYGLMAFTWFGNLILKN